ncbi:beta-carotene 15,15'-monooxygenase, Brp/Blh family [Micromonospora nigra]|uniref:Probable beta-carotene 15,15'-dioxygenase n=1 Tax=Micromonospora nigra TaxID=145857 RepID=A0A1C6S3Z8_9ACTN|nr:Brp/Blh family beta-carotene 15,15'-dioxygenase [Micromonospora nigra]SCL23994.1 beta-carotene 15,15'-monooxygenase, Brp/Blh family [Micromonospora nigra]
MGVWADQLPARVAVGGSRALVVAVLAVELVVPGGWGDADRALLLAGLVVGVPHGALDHLVPRIVLGRRAPHPALLAAGYATLVVVVFLAFRALPGVGLLAFLLLSVAHFGTGETAVADLRAGRPPQAAPLTAAAFGATVVLLPLAAHPTEVGPLVAALSGGAAGLTPGQARAGVAAVLTLAALAGVRLLRRGDHAVAAELALLVTLVLVVPPLAAFGAYFGGWHAPRHLARLVAADPVNAADLAAGRLARPLGRLARQAAPPSLAALGALAVFWLAADWPESAATALMLVAALTVPHALVVAVLDRRAGPPRTTPRGSRAGVGS